MRFLIFFFRKPAFIFISFLLPFSFLTFFCIFFVLLSKRTKALLCFVGSWGDEIFFLLVLTFNEELEVNETHPLLAVVDDTLEPGLALDVEELTMGDVGELDQML